MKYKLLGRLWAVFLLATLVPAQAQWQVPNHAAPIGKGGRVTGFGSVGPCAANQTLVWSSAAADPACSTLRERLTGARSYYVRTDSGSGTCTADTNTAGGACPTIQAAYNACVALDLNGNNCTISVGAGSTGPLSQGTAFINTTTPIVGGSPTNVILSGAGSANTSLTTTANVGNAAFQFSGLNNGITFQNVKLLGSGSGANASCQIYSTGYSQVYIGADVDFGTMACHMVGQFNGNFYVQQNYKISGSSTGAHVTASFSSTHASSGIAVTITNSSTLGIFVSGAQLSGIRMDAMTFSGASTSTGNQCSISTNAYMQYGGLIFPGAAGTCSAFPFGAAQ